LWRSEGLDPPASPRPRTFANRILKPLGLRAARDCEEMHLVYHQGEEAVVAMICYPSVLRAAHQLTRSYPSTKQQASDDQAHLTEGADMGSMRLEDKLAICPLVEVEDSGHGEAVGLEGRYVLRFNAPRLLHSLRSGQRTTLLRCESRPALVVHPSPSATRAICLRAMPEARHPGGL